MKTDVTFTYKNYRGEASVRLVRPIMVAFGSTGFHPEPQWLLHAWDINKEAERTFAMKDIKDWEGVSQPIPVGAGNYSDQDNPKTNPYPV
jgi:predicted DNA-binding transcriptional regulator YafY